MRILALICLLLAPAVPAAAQDEPDLFKQKACIVCHSIGEDAADKVGPPLNGIVGQPLARVAGYDYSQTLMRGRDQGLVWDRELLLRFLKKPSHVFPGTKMSYAGIKDRAEIEALIDYLAGFDEEGRAIAP